MDAIMDRLFKRIKSRAGRILYSVILVISLIVADRLGNDSYAEELGGFDITTDVGAFEEDINGWDDETFQEENSSVEEKTLEDQNNGRNNSEEVFVSDSTVYEQEPAAVEKPANKITEEDKMSQGTAGTEAEISSQQREKELSEEMLSESSQILTPEPSPTLTETIMPSPTLAVEITPLLKTENIVSDEDRNEEADGYYIPPAECINKMKLSYGYAELGKGKNAEIFLDRDQIAGIVSVCVNEKEVLWKEKADRIEIELEEGDNTVRVAVMMRWDLAWTYRKKNVILSYNVFT